jgi:hypothetical protein
MKKRQSNGHVKFTFVEDSRSKLVCINPNDLKFTHYSFDGRESAFSQKLKLWDHPNQFTFERGVSYLKAYFEKKLANQEWRSVFISDSAYPSGGKIEIYRNLKLNLWQPTKPIYETTPSVFQTIPELFLFKLWVPIYNAPAKIFFSNSGIDPQTGEVNKYEAILSLKAQYLKWIQSTKLRPQERGQVYGNGDMIYNQGDTPPNTYYFDTNAVEIYYHHTKRRPQILVKAIQIYQYEF